METEIEEKYISVTEKEVFSTIKMGGKSLISVDTPDGGFTNLNGIDYLNGFLNLNQALTYFGIDKTITIEQQGDLQVLCIR